MSRPVRICALGPHREGPEAQVWIVQPSAAPEVTRQLASRVGRKPRILVEGRCDPGSLTGEVATVSAFEPIGALAVQRALVVGAQVVVTGPVERGACAVGAAAWYHGWKFEEDLHRAAGALVGAVALRAVRGGVPVVEIDDHGGFLVGPTDRDTVLGRVLLERATGPSLPEVEVQLSSLYLHSGGEGRVRGWGATGERTPSGPPTARVSFRGETSDVPVLGPASQRSVPMELSESTLPMEVLGAGVRHPPADEVAVVQACDHGDHLVLAIWAREPSFWPWVEDWALTERATDWLGTPARLLRTSLPNVSAVRFVISGWKGTPEQLVATIRAETVQIGFE